MEVSVINDTITVTHPDGAIYFANGDFANCTVSACPIELSVYGYRPSLAASITLIALYAVLIVIQVFLSFRYRGSWWFMVCMVLGCVDEIIGYVGRILYYQNPWDDAGFIMQIVLITIGPVFLAAAIYVLLARLVKFFGAQYSRFNPKWYIWTFIPCDIISLILQAAGGAMSATSNGGSDSGVNIALAGLAFQVATLVIFGVLVVDFIVRSHSVWRTKVISTRIKLFCVSLALSTILILVRCSYRVYELSEGYSRDSEALRDEPLFIGLESVMVVLAAYCLIPAHPGFAFHHEHDGADGAKGYFASESKRVDAPVDSEASGH